jgi:hypothetical protein
MPSRLKEKDTNVTRLTVDIVGMTEVLHLLRYVTRTQSLILNKLEIQMGRMEDLEAAVGRNTDAEQAVVTLLDGIAQQLRDAQGDPAKIDAVIQRLTQNNANLAEAVVRNTPAEQPPSGGGGEPQPV